MKNRMLAIVGLSLLTAVSASAQVLQSRTGGNVVTLTVPSDYRPDRANQDVLEFQRMGAIWVLKQVRVGGYEQQVHISKSSQAELAKVNAPAQSTLVASIAAAP